MALGQCRAAGFSTMNSREFIHSLRAKMVNALREIWVQKYGKELSQMYLRRKKKKKPTHVTFIKSLSYCLNLIFFLLLW